MPSFLVTWSQTTFWLLMSYSIICMAQVEPGCVGSKTYHEQSLRLSWMVFFGKNNAQIGFPGAFVQLIMNCVCAVTFSLIINGASVGFVTPQRGLHQGDPISPFLFSICIEGLSSLISHAVASNSLHGLRICSQAPIISHLLFADDSILFCKASREQAQVIKYVLYLYERSSG